MSGIPCKYCGVIRKCEQVHAWEGDANWWINPPCWSCDAPGWDQPFGADPFDSQPPPPVAESVRGEQQ
jgi:hypothetical protein